MKHFKIVFIVSIFLLNSCASIPEATVTLTQEISSEVDNMHNLNLNLIRQLFNERQQRLHSFINNTYTPKLIKKYQSLLPDSIDYKNNLTEIIGSIIPVIEHKKDSLTDILNQQENTIISKLNQNYSSFSKATNSLQNLISSAARVGNSEKNLISSIDSLTGNKINILKIETDLNNAINKTTNIFHKLQPFESLIK
ncbi:hypothetical protein SAMN04489761_1079 [Tenacibaculum sp. MAR_2009_124]|uniref:hypothetical protein n=1 Tax=Tenacibaculum sp. MAR_2009_124 TaxID=1250059 RepID=UPI0008944179|nr:hypothetical protein [Tenacibaculum sp. MAR_2009_124]SEB50238.1 hypothetical protein SAMN04489761_1079 [Tenacibaculum sp. MAR_2009_124]